MKRPKTHKYPIHSRPTPKMQRYVQEHALQLVHNVVVKNLFG